MVQNKNSRMIEESNHGAGNLFNVSVFCPERHYIVSPKLSLADSTDRAGTLASTAIDASICVDLVLRIALRNSLNGAGTCACAAADASIINNTCHFVILLSVIEKHKNQCLG